MNLSTPLHEAVIKNDASTLETLAADLGDVNVVDENGFTPLEMACLLGRGKCAETLGGIAPEFKVLKPCQYILEKFSADELLLEMGVAYVPTLRFGSYDHLLQTIHELPISYAMDAIGKEMTELGSQYRDAIFRGEVANISIVWINEILEYGAICNRHIQPGEFIGTYGGDLRQIVRGRPWLNEYCVHYPTKWASLNYHVLDARFYGNAMRFVNHSDEPNLAARWVIDRGLMHLLFFAKEFIPRGSQLTVDYGADFWTERKKAFV